MGNNFCNDQEDQTVGMYRNTSNSTYGAHYPRGYSVSHKVPSLVSQKPVGLQNLTNTCYISSILQILFLILPETLIKNKGRITQLFFKLKDTKSTKDYKTFKLAVQKYVEIVQGYDQQDAQQFLVGFLELLDHENSQGKIKGPVNSLDYNPKIGLEENYKNFIGQMRKIQSSQIINLFSAQLIRQFECPRRDIKHKFQRYQCLSLSFPTPQTTGSKYSYSSSHTQISLMELIKEQMKPEQISDLICEKCKKKTDFTKSTFLYTLPKYLILHLARFKKGYYTSQKINTIVQYDEYLNLRAQSTKSDVKYRLLGTVNHFGSLNRGHYFSQLRYKDNSWYEVNDDEVRSARIEARGNKSKYVYILFYERMYS